MLKKPTTPNIKGSLFFYGLLPVSRQSTSAHKNSSPCMRPPVGRIGKRKGKAHFTRVCGSKTALIANSDALTVKISVFASGYEESGMNCKRDALIVKTSVFARRCEESGMGCKHVPRVRPPYSRLCPLINMENAPSNYVVTPISIASTIPLSHPKIGRDGSPHIARPVTVPQPDTQE